MYQVIYGKRFVSGIMSGLFAEEIVKFPTWYDAERFRKSMEQHSKKPIKPCVGSSYYVVDYAILEAV
jgi:hypothetical protein